MSRPITISPAISCTRLNSRRVPLGSYSGGTIDGTDYLTRRRERWSPRSIASAIRDTRYTRSVERVLSHATIRDRSSLAAFFRRMVIVLAS